MRHLLLAVVVATMAGAVGYADEDKKKEDKDEKKADFTSLRKEFMDKYKGSKKDEDRQAAMKEYGPKFLEFAEKNEKDKEAFGAVMFALQIGSMTKDTDFQKKAVGLLRKSHLSNAELERALPMLAGVLGKDAGPLMTEVMEKGGTDKIKGAACSALIEAKESALAEAKGEEKAKLQKEMAELRKIGVEKFKMKDLFVGATLPDLKSENLDGKAVKLSDHRGKVVVLDIWATWCGPCVAMIPHERELVKKMKGKPFVLISVSFDEEKETLTKFLKEKEMPWTHWWNGRKGEIGDQLNVQFFPTIYILDGKGVIRYKGVRGEAMDKAVEALVKEIEDDPKKSSE